MASAVDSRLAYARLSAVATASRLPTATRGSNNSYTTSWDTTLSSSWEDGIRPDRFADWYRELRHHASELVDRPPRMNPHIVRGLRVMIVARRISFPHPATADRT